MKTSWKRLGSPEFTPAIQKKLIDGVHAEVGSRSIEELEAERDEVLLGLLELRTNYPRTVSPHEVGRNSGRLDDSDCDLFGAPPAY